MKTEILGSVLPWFSVKEDTKFGCIPWAKKYKKGCSLYGEAKKID